MSINVMPKFGLRPYAPVRFDHAESAPERGTTEYTRIKNRRRRHKTKRIYNYIKRPVGRGAIHKTANA